MKHVQSTLLKKEKLSDFFFYIGKLSDFSCAVPLVWCSRMGGYGSLGWDKIDQYGLLDEAMNHVDMEWSNTINKYSILWFLVSSWTMSLELCHAFTEVRNKMQLRRRSSARKTN